MSIHFPKSLLAFCWSLRLRPAGSRQHRCRSLPNVCVSCHVLDKSKGKDERLSIALKQWMAGKVEPGLLAKSKASAPPGLTLKGSIPRRTTRSRTSRVRASIAMTPLEEGTAFFTPAAPGAPCRRHEQCLCDDVQERLHELSQAQHANRGVDDAERPGEIAAARALAGIQPKIRFITGTMRRGPAIAAADAMPPIMAPATPHDITSCPVSHSPLMRVRGRNQSCRKRSGSWSSP